MTLLDVIILLVLAAAAAGGFARLGGAARAGRLLGLLVGAGLGAAWCSRLAALGDGPGAAYALGLTGVLAGLLLGGAAGGLLGGLLGRTLARAHLSVVDRLLGAVAGAAGALLVIWLVSWVVPTFAAVPVVVDTALDAAGGHSRVVASVDRVLPDTATTAHELARDVVPDSVHPHDRGEKP